MIEEVRAERPDVDWAKLEARLFDDRGEVRAPAPAPKRRVAMLGVFAVAAAFAFAMFSPTRVVEETVQPQVAKVVRPAVLQAGAAVAVGTTIEGGAEGAWLRSLGRVSIRFEPGSRGVLVDDGERIRIALQSGAVAADVTPVPGGEPFAVDVMGKRVAVHGTHLRVAMLGDSVEVAVSEGNAVIGEPAGEGRTEGPLVLAGSIGTFSSIADRARIPKAPSRATSLVEDALAMRKHVEPALAAKQPEIPSLPPTVVTPHAPAKPAAVAPTVAVAPSVVPPAPVPDGLSSEQLATPLGLVDGDVKKCLQSMTLPNGVSFTAKLTLEISPAGKIVDPSLNDIPIEHRECVRTALAKIVFPVAATRTTVEREIVFTGK
ncbi:MAG: FecR domain-containing protein, partial [Polyangiales bacterium]